MRGVWWYLGYIYNILYIRMSLFFWVFTMYVQNQSVSAKDV